MDIKAENVPQSKRQGQKGQEAPEQDAHATMYAENSQRALIACVFKDFTAWEQVQSAGLTHIYFTDHYQTIVRAIEATAPQPASVLDWLDQQAASSFPLAREDASKAKDEMWAIIQDPASSIFLEQNWIDQIKRAYAFRTMYYAGDQMVRLASHPKIDPFAEARAMMERLQTIIDAAQPEEEQDDRFRIYSLDEMLQRPVAPWVLHGIYRAGMRGVIYGASYSGKSILLGDLGLSFVTGLDWQEEKMLQSGIVLYIAAEDADGIARQAQTWLSYHSKTLADVRGRFHLIEDAVDLMDSADVARLIARIQKQDIKPDLVIIDTFTECFAGDVIDNKQLRQAFQGIGAIEKTFSCGSLTIGHTNKAGVSWLGGQYTKANVDFMAELSQDENGIITLRCEKLRGAPKFKDRKHKLRIFASEQPDEKVCVLVPATDAPVSTGQLPPLQHLALCALKDGMGSTAWHKATGEGSDSAWYDVLNKLQLAGYVTKDEHKRYHLTEKAQQYLAENSKSLQKDSTRVIRSEDVADPTTPNYSTRPIGRGVIGVVEQSLPLEEEMGRSTTDKRTLYNATGQAMPTSDGTSARLADLAVPTTQEAQSVPADRDPIDFLEGKKRISDPEMKRISKPRMETSPQAQPEEPPVDESVDRCACGAIVEKYAPDGTPYCEAHYPAEIDDIERETARRPITPPGMMKLPSKSASHPHISAPAIVQGEALTHEPDPYFWLEIQASRIQYANYAYAGITYGEGKTMAQRRDDWQRKLKALDKVTARQFMRHWQEELQRTKGDR